MPPFLHRLAQQASGSILRKGIHLDGNPYWEEWRKDVTGTGISLDSFADRWLQQAILYGHSSLLVDFANELQATTLLQQRQVNAQPYLSPVLCQQILGWRVENRSGKEWLTQLRVRETVSIPEGRFGETITHQVRLMEATAGGTEPVRWQVWREVQVDEGQSSRGTIPWFIFEEGQLPTNEIPLFTIYGDQLGRLTASRLCLRSRISASVTRSACGYPR